MAETTPAWLDEGARLCYGRYKQASATSVELKSSVELWQNVSLLIGVLGAAAAFASSQCPDTRVKLVAGLVGGVALAVGGVVSRLLGTPERERDWVRARSAAEAFKSELNLFRAGAPPYDGAKPFDELAAHLDRLQTIMPKGGWVPLTEEERLKGFQSGRLTVDQYIAGRLDGQREFFNGSVARHRSGAKAAHNWALFFALIAAILSVVAGVDRSSVMAGLVPVLTTIAGAIAATYKARRHDYLVTSHQAMEDKLERLAAGWRASGMTDANTAERNRFIAEVEKALTTENSGWVAEFNGQTAVTPPAKSP